MKYCHSLIIFVILDEITQAQEISYLIRRWIWKNKHLKSCF